jgi:predicted XRE-type DNA-binding protein
MPKTKITRSSGNVFADIGIPEPEEALAKADLARKINQMIESRGLTQAQAAEILGVDQPRVSALNRGRLSFFSLEKLLDFVSRLGRDVEIKITTPAPHRHAHHGRILVVDSGTAGMLWNSQWSPLQGRVMISCSGSAQREAAGSPPDERWEAGLGSFPNPPPNAQGRGIEACPPFQ